MKTIQILCMKVVVLLYRGANRAAESLKGFQGLFCKKSKTGEDKNTKDKFAQAQPPSIQTQKAASPLVATVAKKLIDASPTYGQILKTCGLVEKDVYQVLAKPVGHNSSGMAFEVTKKYAIGTLFTRTDGRTYRIYRVKKTKRTRPESMAAAPLWRTST